MKKRILAAMLAALALMPTLAACANDTSDTETDADTSASTVQESEAETRVTDDLPANLNYGGDEIVIASRYREGWTSGELTVEKTIGEPVNDAVFERNKTVEERLGVTLTNIPDSEPDASDYMQKISTVIMSGEDEYDIVAAACYVAVQESLNGTFADLRKSEHLDFEKPWWSQGYNEVVEYQGTQYAVTGSILLSMYRFAFVTAFNKNMFDDAKVSYLYEDVRNGTWTLARQTELVSIFHKDVVNQGKQDIDGDVFGLVTNDYISVDPYWSSCGVDVLQKNEDGQYEYVFDSRRLHGVAEQILKLYYQTGGAVYDFKHTDHDGEQADIRKMFASDGAAMATMRLLEFESAEMRDMTSIYGVVPMPKYEASQKVHRTLLHDQFTVLSIPTTAIERMSQISAVLEALGSASHYTVRPAYYETTLRTKIAQDPDSAEMLDTIINNVYIDAGIIYTKSLETFHDQFRLIIGSKTNTVVSKYNSITKKVLHALNDINTTLSKLAEGK